MAQSVARRKRRGKPPPRSAEQRRQQQQQLRRALEARIAPVVQAAFEEALADEVTVLLGRPKHARRGEAPLRRAGATCARCQQDWAPRFSRAGSYRRTLITTVATVRLRVPRVSCVCGGQVPLEFATFGRYERSWGDLQARVRQLAGLCLSLPDIQEVVAGESGSWLAASTLNRWVHEAAALAAVLRGEPFARVPAVVLLDGVWVKLMVETGARYHDRRGRDRPRVRRVTVPLLVAYGVDPVTGERWLLDWEQGAGEDTASWQGLLESLEHRGLRADAGLTLFVSDGSSGLEAAFGQVDFGPGGAPPALHFPRPADGAPGGAGRAGDDPSGQTRAAAGGAPGGERDLAGAGPDRGAARLYRLPGGVAGARAGGGGGAGAGVRRDPRLSGRAGAGPRTGGRLDGGVLAHDQCAGAGQSSAAPEGPPGRHFPSRARADRGGGVGPRPSRGDNAHPAPGAVDRGARSRAPGQLT